MNPAGETPNWQAAMKADIGENPVHFLDRPLRVDDSLPPMIRDRIKGIDRLEVLRAYRAVERKLQRGEDIQTLPDDVDPDDLDFYKHDIEPGRQPVLDALDDREQYLETYGERPRDRTAQWPHELPDRYRGNHDRVVPEKECIIVERDRNGNVVERTPYHEARGSSATAKLNSIRSVATDGSGSR